jgi:hypothetical protein
VGYSVVIVAQNSASSPVLLPDAACTQKHYTGGIISDDSLAVPKARNNEED